MRWSSVRSGEGRGVIVYAAWKRAWLADARARLNGAERKAPSDADLVGLDDAERIFVRALFDGRLLGPPEVLIRERYGTLHEPELTQDVGEVHVPAVVPFDLARRRLRGPSA